MTAVLLGAIRTLINFHSCLGICLSIGKDSVVRACFSFRFMLSFWAKERIFAQGYRSLAFVQAPILDQSMKTMKRNMLSWAGPGSHLTLYLDSRSIQELHFRRGENRMKCKGIILWYSFQPPTSHFIILPNISRDTVIWYWYVNS